jgi:molybdenum cofactor biosynthesis protein B
MAQPAHQEHRQQATNKVRCAVMTVSDTRTPETDSSGLFIQQALTAAGHQISAYCIVKDEPEDIRRLLQQYIQAPDTDAVLLSGGTGLSPRDGTYEVVQACLDKELTGFGELFRFLSYAEIGAAAMMSRATAGVASGTVIVSMPGSSAAVRLAMEKLIVPELAHMAHIARG